MVIEVDEYISDNQGCTRGGAVGLQPLPPNAPKPKFKRDGFV
jgi:hypothetical protein